jgi:hypothetical protein
MNGTQRKAAEIASHLMELFDEDSESFLYDLDDIDATELFTAMLMANKLVFSQIANGDEDLIGFTHLQNRLAVQYVMAQQKSENGGD